MQNRLQDEAQLLLRLGSMLSHHALSPNYRVQRPHASDKSARAQRALPESDGARPRASTLGSCSSTLSVLVRCNDGMGLLPICIRHHRASWPLMRLWVAHASQNRKKSVLERPPLLLWTWQRNVFSWLWPSPIAPSVFCRRRGLSKRSLLAGSTTDRSTLPAPRRPAARPRLALMGTMAARIHALRGLGRELGGASHLAR